MQKPGKQMRHYFSANDYESASQDYAESWETIDGVLYQLCRRYPMHTDRLPVTAKVIIIGRTYATGIERKVPTTGTQGSSISQVVSCLVSHGKELDEWLNQLEHIEEPLSGSNIEKILTVHGSILNLLRKLTIRGQAARSFVSKYLHFHNPTVPIYDSIAANFLPKLIRLRRDQIYTAVHADQEYATYISRFAKLYESASKTVSVTVRLLDYYLIWKKENA
jgi:hypothetical protein